MLKALLGSLFRHLLTSGGGAIVAQGLLSGDQLNQLVGGATAVVGVAMAVWQKIKASKALKDVAAAGSTSAPKYNN